MPFSSQNIAKKVNPKGSAMTNNLDQGEVITVCLVMTDGLSNSCSDVISFALESELIAEGFKSSSIWRKSSTLDELLI
jgi:hypothetical protein